jgi:type I restriction enzyme S subunit
MSVPKLRFPEFRDVGEWEEKKLIDICERITQGGTPDTLNPDYWNGSIEWLTPSEMGKTETRFIESTVRKITQVGLKNCSSELLPINSVIISTRAPIGHLAINKSDMAINQGCKGLIPIESTNYDFLYYSLLKFKTSLIDLGAGNTFKELAGNSLKNFEIPVPSLPEQQKIAKCLSFLDDRITAETQKLDTLKAHKKGLMQQLFPAEGETIPKLRFPEFRDAGEWEEKKLGDMAEKISDGIHSTPTYNETGQYYFINGNNLAEDKIVINGFTKRVDEIEYLKYKTELSSQTILISINGTIGNLAFFNNEKVVLGKSACYINLKPNENKYFVFNLLKTSNIQKYLKKELTGSTIKNLSLASIKNAKAFFPVFTEQQKIVDCLSSLDNLITAQTQKIDALKLHKKGLMQQLFSSVKEVKG